MINTIFTCNVHNFSPKILSEMPHGFLRLHRKIKQIAKHLIIEYRTISSQRSFCLQTIAEDSVLHREVSRMSLNKLEDVQLDIPVESRRIRDFFLLMVVCNTVVVSATDHHAHDQVWILAIF